MTPSRRTVMVMATAGALAPAMARAATPGFTQTRGGTGGRVIPVTTLNAFGDGSLNAALEAKGPRIIVFEVGGVIDLGRQTLKITEPFVTVAGETAPDPGITLIRGEISVQGHDVIVRHIAVRPGDAGAAKTSGFEPDGLTTWKAHDVVIDHCSLTWAVDEALSASGPRFDGGDTVEAWRQNTSRNITFTRNLIGRSLRNASHSKGPHSMGSLIHDNVTGVLVAGNLYADVNERHPLLKGGARAVVVNNVFVNPGHVCTQYTLVADQWQGRTPEPGLLVLAGNTLRGGGDSPDNLALLTFGGSGDLRLHATDNVAIGRDGHALPFVRYYQAKSDGMPDEAPYIPKAEIHSLPRELYWPAGLKLLPAAEAERRVYADCGTRPWARDPIDQRIIDEAKAGTGRLIDSQDEMGGYPVRPAARRPFNPKTLLKT